MNDSKYQAYNDHTVVEAEDVRAPVVAPSPRPLAYRVGVVGLTVRYSSGVQ